MNFPRFKGFTLIEVLAASAILASVLASFVVYSAENLSLSRNVEILVRATVLAEREMERIKQALEASQQGRIAGGLSELEDHFLIRRTLTSIHTDLTRIEVTLGYDTDRNRVLDLSEELVSLKTQHATRN